MKNRRGSWLYISIKEFLSKDRPCRCDVHT